MDFDQLPYFSTRGEIDYVLKPLKKQIEIRFLGFKRCYPNREQFYFTDEVSFWFDYISQEYYRLGYFEKNFEDYGSTFHMWDHLPFDSSRRIYRFLREQYNFPHGLTIMQQHGSYCDFFVFASRPCKSAINIT